MSVKDAIIQTMKENRVKSTINKKNILIYILIGTITFFVLLLFLSSATNKAFALCNDSTIRTIFVCSSPDDADFIKPYIVSISLQNTDKVSKATFDSPFHNEKDINDASHTSSEHNDKFLGGIIVLAIILVLVVLTLLIFLVVDFKNKQKEKEYNEKLRLAYEEYSIVAEQCDRAILKYDIVNDILYTIVPISDALPEILENATTFFRDTELISDETKSILKQYQDDIKSGITPLSFDLHIYINDKSIWYQFSSTLVMDTNNKPNFAILSAYDCTEQKKNEAAYKRWKQKVSSSIGSFASVMEIDITHNRMESAEYSQNYFRKKLAVGNFYKQLPEALAAVHPDDRQKVEDFFDKNSLIKSLWDDVTQRVIELREYYPPTKNYRWSRMQLDLISFNNNKDIFAYVVNRDINDEKEREAELLLRSERDNLTGAYNRATFIEKSKQVLSDYGPDSVHAMLYIDYDDFKLVNDTFGHLAGDDSLKQTIAAAKSFLGENDFIGRMGGDEFIIFLVDIDSEQTAVEKTQAICAAMKQSLSDGISLSVSIGVSLYPQDGITVTELYHKADMALYHVKEFIKGSYCLYSDTLKSLSSDIKGSYAKQNTYMHIAHISDNQDDISALASTFFGNFTISVYNDIDKATNSFDDWLPLTDFVLLDLDLPHSDIFVSQLKSKSVFYNFSVIAYAKSIDNETRNELIRIGFFDCLVKPLDYDFIRIKILSFIGNKENLFKRLHGQFYSQHKQDEEKYKQVLLATNTVVFIVDKANGVFVPDINANKYISGNFDSRTLYRVLAEDGIASSADIEQLKKNISEMSDERRTPIYLQFKLKTNANKFEWFDIALINLISEDTTNSRVLVTFNNVDDKVKANIALQRKAEYDALTGLYNKETFFEKLQSKVSKATPNYYALVSYDINNFKFINDQFGYEEGNKLIQYLASCFYERIDKNEYGISCHISADDFAFLLPTPKDDFANFVLHLKNDVQKYSLPFDYKFEFKIGVFIINDLSLSPDAMLDRATIARISVRDSYRTPLSFYDESMRKGIIAEQFIIGQMHTALDGEQFIPYFQPQYNHSKKTVIGAEVLARWIHPEKGFISPVEFVPIFEKNGFIVKLDSYIFKQACITLNRWKSMGITIPLSVNVSRLDLLDDDFISYIIQTAKNYDIAPESLNLEITESAFSLDQERILSAIKFLQKKGFPIEIDDFGSGYSSLNILKEVPADILKLDMRFLDDSGDNHKGGNILQSIVRMAKWLDLPVIAEGVETIEQADFLTSIGCSYIQGYFYAKPMPLDDVETLLLASTQERKITTSERLVNINSNKFWTPDSIETLIYNNYVGPAAVVEYDNNGRLEVIRVNENYINEMGGPFIREKLLKTNVFSTMDDANARILLNTIKKAIETGVEAFCETTRNSLNSETNKIHLRTWLRVIVNNKDHCLLYARVENVTGRRYAERKLKDTTEQLQKIMDNISSGVCATAVDLAHDVYIPVFLNKRFRNIFNMVGSSNDNRYTIADTIAPENLNIIRKHLEKCISTNLPVSFEYRGIQTNGTPVYLQCTCTAMRLDNVAYPVCLTLVNDVTSEMEMLRAYKSDHETIQHILLNGSGGFVIFKLDADNKIYLDYINNAVAIKLQSNIKDLYKKYSKHPIDLLHPDDYEPTKKALWHSLSTGENLLTTLRARRSDGEYIWVNLNGRITTGVDGKPSLTCCILDISNEKENEEFAFSVLNHLNVGVGLFETDGSHIHIIYLNNKFADITNKNISNIMNNFSNSPITAIHPDDRNGLLRNINKGVQTLSPFTQIVRLKHGDYSSDKYITCEIYCSFVFKEDGKALMYVSFLPIHQNTYFLDEL